VEHLDFPVKKQVSVSVFGIIKEEATEMSQG
jgi:hypothetical protein